VAAPVAATETLAPSPLIAPSVTPLLPTLLNTPVGALLLVVWLMPPNVVPVHPFVTSSAVSETELIAFCKERLAEFKRPKQIHITDTIPRTATGKIQRGAVAQAFTQQGR